MVIPLRIDSVLVILFVISSVSDRETGIYCTAGKPTITGSVQVRFAGIHCVRVKFTMTRSV